MSPHRQSHYEVIALARGEPDGGVAGLDGALQQIAARATGCVNVVMLLQNLQFSLSKKRTCLLPALHRPACALPHGPRELCRRWASQ